jgi:hypothetical protein
LRRSGIDWCRHERNAGSAGLTRRGHPWKRDEPRPEIISGPGLSAYAEAIEFAQKRGAIIRDGLIYVIDIRNGLYVLRYTGPHADEAANISFLEGNSNLGDAERIAKNAGP